MTTPYDKRLIEDYLPIVAISAEASSGEGGAQGAHFESSPLVGTTSACGLPRCGIRGSGTGVPVRA